jgi:metal-responsive CopG/Arc/MetJ family transcriptional regulator
MSANPCNRTIVSVNLTRRIVHDLQQALTAMGYASRSELVRDAVRAFLRDKRQIDALSGRVDGVLTLLYNRAADAQVSEAHHRHLRIFRSFMHSDFDIERCPCCAVLVFSGNAPAVRRAYYDISSIKGVEEAHLFIASC